MVTYVAVLKTRLYGFGYLIPVQLGFLERKCLKKNKLDECCRIGFTTSYLFEKVLL